MAKEGHLQVRESYPASADLSSNDNFIFANLDGNDKLEIAGAGELAVVLRNTKDLDAADKEGTVVLFGKTKVKAGGSINAFDQLTPDANGKAVTATAANVDASSTSTSEDVAGDQVCAIALQDADSDDLVKVAVVLGGLS